MIKLKACIFIWISSAFVQTRGKQCDFPTLPSYSESVSPIKEKYEDNSHFYYKCAEGYQFKEHGTERHKIRCDNGHWNPTNLWKCLDKCNNQCGAHGKCVTTIGSSTGDTVTSCQCDSNYAGKTCQARVCEMPNMLEHHLPPILKEGTHLASPGKYSVGSKIVYHCESGYEIKKGPLRPIAVCQLSGWSPSAIPPCQEKTCSPMDIPNGVYYPMKPSYKAGDLVTYTCNTDFRLQGEEATRCTSDGQWSPPKSPACERVISDGVCGPPPEVRHSIRTGAPPPYIIGSQVTYTCVEGFSFNGNAHTVYCRERGTWDTPPQCYNKHQCGSKDKIMVERNKKLYCVDATSVTKAAVSTTVKPLTIVTATAGALLLLLLIVISLVAYQRRRIALNNRRLGRNRLNQEDDRCSYVYFSNDVHLVLPSYDEAMRVQGSQPPPYHMGNADAVTDYPPYQAEPSEPTPEYATLSENVTAGRQVTSGNNGENIYAVIDEARRNLLPELEGTPGEPLSTTALSDIAASTLANEHDYAAVEKYDSNKKAGSSLPDNKNPTAADRDSISSQDSTTDDVTPLINN